MTLRLAFLGTGLATSLHSKTMKAMAPDVERWYASRDRARAEATRTQFGGAGAFGSYDAALGDRNITAVLVALPPSLHLEWTMRALDAGKHVILEKPPLLRSGDVAAVKDAARRADRQVLVAENYYYKPLAITLRRTIARGDLGDLRFLHLNALKQQSTSGGWRGSSHAPSAGSTPAAASRCAR